MLGCSETILEEIKDQHGTLIYCRCWFCFGCPRCEASGTNPSSNVIDRIDGFWELGRENSDGAITGTIWKGVGKNEKGIDCVRRAGGFRIEGDGTISRFPYASRYDRERAEMEGMKRFHETYGPRGQVVRYENPRNTEYRFNFVVE